MTENQYASKVIFGGQVLIDLTADTITEESILSGFTAHKSDGSPVTGACPFDVDSTDATAQVAEILVGKTAYARGAKMTGTMPNNEGVDLSITGVSQEVLVPQGYHDGSGKAHIDAVDQAKLIPQNIREGITVLGVEGTMSGSEDMHPQARSVTPQVNEFTVLPDSESGYNCLSQVVVAAIPYSEAENPAGGITVTIAST